MDENVNDQDVLLVKEKDSEKLQAVAGADNKGNLKTVPPKQENEPDFLKIDKHGNVLENFFANLSRQYKDPTHFQFFKAPLNLVEKVSVALGEMLKNPDTQSNKEMLDTVRADRIKIPNEIKGVNLDETQKRFLAEGKAIYLEGMTAKSGKEFSATVQVNADKKGIEFRFADSTKQSNDRNQSQPKSQSEKPEYFIPKKLGGVELKDEQQTKLKEGGTIYVEGMKDKEGKLFNAYVKFNFEEGKPKFYKWNPDKTKEVPRVCSGACAG